MEIETFNWIALIVGMGFGVAITLSIYNRRSLNTHWRVITRLQADVIDLKFNPKKHW